MTEEKNQPSAFEVLQGLFEFAYGDMDDIESMPIEEVRKCLQEEGIDPKQLVKAIRQRINEAIGRQKLVLARMDRKKFLEQLKNIKVPEEVGNVIKTLSGNNPDLAQVYMRKFQEADKKDHQRLAKDLLALDELEKSNE